MGEFLPPQDIEAEQALIGSVLFAPDSLADVGQLVAARDFYRTTHADLWDELLTMDSDGTQIDPITVAAHLDRKDMLQRIGGAPYLHTLMDRTFTGANGGYYAAIVREKAGMRRMVEAGQRLVQLGAHGAETSDIDSVVEAARAELDDATVTARPVGADEVTLDDALSAARESFDSPATPGVPTGMPDIDHALRGGLRRRSLVIVGGRPGGGKSLVVMAWALEAAKRGVPVLLVSLEMGADEISERILAYEAKVRLDHILERQLDEYDLGRIERAQERLEGVPLTIEQSPRLTVAALRRIARNHARSRRGLGLIVVDYLQQMTPADERVVREQQVAGISRGLKLTAMELAVPLVAAAQTRRTPDGSKPTMSDLRESGSIEADADAVCLLGHPEEDERFGEVDAHWVKNRRGARTVIPLEFSPSYARIASISRLSEPMGVS